MQNSTSKNEIKAIALYLPKFYTFIYQYLNGWSKRGHLEPSEKWGTQYLEAIKDITNN